MVSFIQWSSLQPRSLVGRRVSAPQTGLKIWRRGNDLCMCRQWSPLVQVIFFLFVFGATAPQWARTSSFTRFLDHTQRRITVSRTSLDEWSACRRDLYLTTRNTHKTDIHAPMRFEPTISAALRLRPSATGTGSPGCNPPNILTTSGLITQLECQYGHRIGFSLVTACGNFAMFSK